MVEQELEEAKFFVYPGWSIGDYKQQYNQGRVQQQYNYFSLISCDPAQVFYDSDHPPVLEELKSNKIAAFLCA